MDKKKPTIYTGSKFFKFNDNQELEIIRVVNIDKKDRVKYKQADGTNKSMSSEYLTSNYHMLKPDGLFMLSIVKNSEVSDTIVALKSFKKEPKRPDLPFAVCRQGIYDFFTNITNNNPDKIIHVGVSVNQDTCPANLDFQLVLTCTALKSAQPIAVYLDDTLEDILSLFSNVKYDNSIKEMSSALVGQFKDKEVCGICSSLKELLITNNFMYDFRKCFDITEVPFSVNAEDECLSMENILFLENELKVNIMETYIVEYSREIDLSKINRKYLLISSAQDNFNKVYICGYDAADGKYLPRSMSEI